MNNEFLHMQKLAGIITEGEYKAKLNENLEDLEKKVFDFFNSPKSNALVDKIVNQLDDKEQAKITSITGGIKESTSDEFSQFKNIVDKISENLEEIQSPYSKDFEPNDMDKAVGKVLSGVGSTSIMSMGTLPIWIAMAVDYIGGTNIVDTVGQAIGSGSGAAVLTTLAGLIGGGILWALGKRLQGKKGNLNNEPIA
jgi:hypothetical protein